MFLVGDIGGTNARFALARTNAKDEIVISDFAKYEAADFEHFHDAVIHYLDGIGHRPTLAVLAVAGPVKNGEAQFTNRGWYLRASEIAANCKVPQVELINDFAAMAQSVPKMPGDSFAEVKDGTPVTGAPLLVAGPGTGFGACSLVPRGGAWLVLPSEGGHSSVAPRTDLEKALYDQLEASNVTVSVERICGGAHLESLVRALSQVHGIAYRAVAPQEIIERAHAGESLYVDICEVRAQTIMAALANMTLIRGTTAGAVIAGGVANHLAEYLMAPAAIDRFCSTWPESDYLQRIPIRLLGNPVAPLIGAAAHYLNNPESQT